MAIIFCAAEKKDEEKRKNFTCPSVALAKEERTFCNLNGLSGGIS